MGMIDDPGSAAIVASTIKPAGVLLFDVVAEGVEDEATLLRLQEMGCFAAQGFGLGRPVLATDVPDLVSGIEYRLQAVLGTGLGGARSSR